MRTAFLALMLTLAWSGAALAALEDGLAAYEQGDYATAYGELQPLAERGDPVAEYTIGRMYLAGQGLPRSVEDGLRWTRKAAEAGEPHAAFQLGRRYEFGIGLPQNYAEAAKWYRAAAERDLAGAQFRLGLCYLNGLGVAQNPVTAHMWLNLAAAKLPPGEIRNNVAKLRDALAGKLSAVQISEAQRLAREWRPRPTP